MCAIRYSRFALLGIGVLYACMLVTPAAVNAEEQVFTMAPVTDSSWDDTSGYGAVEANRAAAMQAPLSNDLMIVRDQARAIARASALAWDETSGYGAVEASRAGIELSRAP